MTFHEGKRYMQKIDRMLYQLNVCLQCQSLPFLSLVTSASFSQSLDSDKKINGNLTDGVVLMIKIAPFANGKFPIWHPICQMGVAQEFGHSVG